MTYTLFILTLNFSKKQIIFQKKYLLRSHLISMFDSDLKWVRKIFLNFSYLVSLELFLKKIFTKNNYISCQAKLEKLRDIFLLTYFYPNTGNM